MTKALSYLHEVWYCPAGAATIFPHASRMGRTETPLGASTSQAVNGYERSGQRHIFRR